jgi:hypothetical protein
MNAQWHAKRKMPRSANLDQRIQWHLDHAKQCGCRPIPPRLLQEIRQRRKNARLTT